MMLPTGEELFQEPQICGHCALPGRAQGSPAKQVAGWPLKLQAKPKHQELLEAVYHCLPLT